VDLPAIHAEMERLAPLGLAGWEFDFIGIHASTRRNVLRLKHASGVRYAVAANDKVMGADPIGEASFSNAGFGVYAVPTKGE